MDDSTEKKINQNEDDKLLIDHSYDGIQELNNRPPPWLMWLFYITVVWAALYGAYYHWFWQGDLAPQDTEYQQELVDAQKLKAKLKAEKPNKTAFDEEKIVMFTEQTDLDEGKKIFADKGCTACHGTLGEGNAVGPNLTDEAWLDGGKPEQVFKTIKYGNTAKGMLAYKDQLKDEQILKLTSWILTSLKGSNPPNAKEAQGN